MAVLALIGLVAAATCGRLGISTLSSASADGYTRRLAIDLMQARRRTIATGENHFLDTIGASGNVTSYQMIRRAAGGDVAVDDVRTTPAGVTVTSTHADLEFDFDGTALGTYVITVNGPVRSWQVSAVMATGTVSVVETTP
jgi:Zn-dependent alcohol dehydrogenase